MTKPKYKVAATKKVSRPNQASNTQPKSTQIGRRAAKAQPAPSEKQALPSALPTLHRDSKQAKVLAMLFSEAGTTIDAIVQVTNWQAHSVRGFFAGVVRKKLKLDLVSQRADGVRIYRVENKPSAIQAAAS